MLGITKAKKTVEAKVTQPIGQALMISILACLVALTALLVAMTSAH